MTKIYVLSKYCRNLGFFFNFPGLGQNFCSRQGQCLSAVKNAKKCGTALPLNGKKCCKVRPKKAKSAGEVRQKMSERAVKCGEELKVVRFSAVFLLQP